MQPDDPCRIIAGNLELRIWDRGDVDPLIELSADPGCRASSGLFSSPMDLSRASHWLDRAAEAMRQQKLGSWAVWQRQRLVGCLNYLDRRLDDPDEWLPVLEFRFTLAAYQEGLAAQAVLGLLPFIQRQHKPKVIYALLTSEERYGRRLAEALNMKPWKSGRYNETSVEIYVMQLAAPVTNIVNAASPMEAKNLHPN